MLTLSKRVMSAVAAMGLLAVGQVALAPSGSALEACGPYAAQVATTVTVTISPASPAEGEEFTATATVTADGQPVPDGGTVEFTYGDATESDNTVGGVATADFVATTDESTVTAAYQGLCVAGTAGGAGPVFFAPSEGSADVPVVAGVQQVARPPVAAPPVVQGVDTLASTGLDGWTQVLLLAGIGLVASGGLVMVLRRRRGPA